MEWVTHFSARAEQRPIDPDWDQGACLPAPIIASLQRFQVGESGDGETLFRHADAAGDPEYSAAIRLFVAEENEHARLLEQLILAAGARPIDSHWSDAAFVAARRALGLRTELLVLSVAELIALSYYGALAQSKDPLLAEVSRRIVDDEGYHVQFQRDRLAAGFISTSPRARSVIGLLWQAFAQCVALVVAADHGGALRAVGSSRWALLRETTALFAGFRRDVFARPQLFARPALVESNFR